MRGQLLTIGSLKLGRYTQADPIGLNGGMNRFGYVGASPVKFVDPKGLESFIVTQEESSLSPFFGHSVLYYQTNHSWNKIEFGSTSGKLTQIVKRGVAFPFNKNGKSNIVSYAFNTLSSKDNNTLGKCVQTSIDKYNKKKRNKTISSYGYTTNNCATNISTILKCGSQISNEKTVMIPSGLVNSLK